MAWKKDNSNFTMEIDPNFDYIIEEGANTSINVRRVSWGGRPFKIDIRKWSYNDGEERAMKGVSLTNEGADELANVLVENGFGSKKRLLKALDSREDEEEDSTNEIDDGSEEYYDPSELLGDV